MNDNDNILNSEEIEDKVDEIKEDVKSEIKDSENTESKQTETADFSGQSEAAPDPYNKYNYIRNNFQGFNPANGNPGYTQNAAPGQYQGQYDQSGQFPGSYSIISSYQYQHSSQSNSANSQAGYRNPIDDLYSGNVSHIIKKEKKEKSKGSKFLSGLAMSAVFGLVAAGVFILVTYFYKQQNPELFETTTRQVQVTTTDNKEGTHLNLDPATDTEVPATSVLNKNTFTGTDVSDVVEKVMPSIVSIDCVTRIYNSFYGPYDAATAGSGIIIEKNDKELMIATNNHVVEDSKEIKVTFSDGTSAAATIKGTDEVADLAVISVKLNDISKPTIDTISIAKLGNSDNVKIGEMAIAIGNSLGYGQSVTVGYISAKDRDITIDGQTFSNLLQTDAAINPGNSGGALINLAGEVIGINNAKIGGTSVEGMGYAIPISRAQNILADFATRETLTTEEQGFLGVTIKTISESTAQMYNWPVGAYIATVVEGGAAEAAGIQKGDIITAINDTVVKNVEKLVEKIQSIRYGTEIKVTLQRLEDGEFVEKTISVVLGKRPAEDQTN
ncbi:MAG: trypsin-like peptidase domain-containing protein [Lachnospiraceae bacterium]|nr:trypsin-like peptidase domain-containing protein [Lachnospiraceae bacterium]